MGLHPEFSLWLKCVCGVCSMAKEQVSLIDILTSSGKYPDRQYHASCTQEVKDNAQILANRLNMLFGALQLTGITINSGFRTPEANAAIANAAKKSNHMMGLAADLADPDGKLDELFLQNLPQLETYELYLESPDSTPTWAHLQSIAPRSGNRVFKP